MSHESYIHALDTLVQCLICIRSSANCGSGKSQKVSNSNKSSPVRAIEASTSSHSFGSKLQLQAAPDAGAAELSGPRNLAAWRYDSKTRPTLGECVRVHVVLMLYDVNAYTTQWADQLRAPRTCFAHDKLLLMCTLHALSNIHGLRDTFMRFRQ